MVPRDRLRLATPQRRLPRAGRRAAAGAAGRLASRFTSILRDRKTLWTFNPSVRCPGRARPLLVTGVAQGLGGDSLRDSSASHERVAFTQLIDRVFFLARSFNFVVPPYFISNVRALGGCCETPARAEYRLSPDRDMPSTSPPWTVHHTAGRPSPPPMSTVQGSRLRCTRRWRPSGSAHQDPRSFGRKFGCYTPLHEQRSHLLAPPSPGMLGPGDSPRLPTKVPLRML